MDSPHVYIEIRQSSLKALRGEAGLELPLERAPSGGLTKACREKLIVSLRGFLKKDVWQARLRAYCAIGARGVSLRRLTLPAATKEDLKRLLALQIESEFPLPPDALAWGYRQIGSPGIPIGQSADSSGAKQELLVVAVKKEVIEEYSGILAECGVMPVFTVAALVRRHAWQHPPQTCALLDVGRNYAELHHLFENGDAARRYFDRHPAARRTAAGAATAWRRARAATVNTGTTPHSERIPAYSSRSLS